MAYGTVFGVGVASWTVFGVGVASGTACGGPNIKMAFGSGRALYFTKSEWWVWHVHHKVGMASQHICL